MLFPFNDEQHGRTVRSVREIVEIVAIIAAGLWAAFVFIYEDRIVPAKAPAIATFTATMEKVSEHNGLIGVRLVTKIRNPGTVSDNFLGLVVAVAGQRIALAPKPKPLQVIDYNVVLDRDANASKPVWVFARGSITVQGDPKSKSGLRVEPGEEQANEYVFYVPSGQYDRLRAYIDARYTREEHEIKTAVSQLPDGMPAFLPHVHNDNLTQFATFVASLDLHGR